MFSELSSTWLWRQWLLLAKQQERASSEDIFAKLASNATTTTTTTNSTAEQLTSKIPFIGWSSQSSDLTSVASSSGFPRNGVCGICLSCRIDAIVKPCNHFYACSNCTGKLYNFRCAVCREPIDQIVSISPVGV